MSLLLGNWSLRLLWNKALCESSFSDYTLTNFTKDIHLYDANFLWVIFLACISNIILFCTNILGRRAEVCRLAWLLLTERLSAIRDRLFRLEPRMRLSWFRGFYILSYIWLYRRSLLPLELRFPSWRWRWSFYREAGPVWPLNEAGGLASTELSWSWTLGEPRKFVDASYGRLPSLSISNCSIDSCGPKLSQFCTITP